MVQNVEHIVRVEIRSHADVARNDPPAVFDPSSVEKQDGPRLIMRPQAQERLSEPLGPILEHVRPGLLPGLFECRRPIAEHGNREKLLQNIGREETDHQRGQEVTGEQCFQALEPLFSGSRGAVGGNEERRAEGAAGDPADR